MNKLQQIQHELKAPKGQFNKFGKYNFRSCEDILEAVKPILHKVECTLTLSDEMVLIGERYYIKATAHLKGEDTDEIVTAYARESATKPGMDDSQITGSASSYARKYALNGLFCIDDTKDADTDEYTVQNTKPTQTQTTQTTQAQPAAQAEVKKEKETLDPKHPHWQTILEKMVAGKGSLKELQGYYIVPAASEEAIKKYLDEHLKKN
jgi:hypothetical protein